MSGEDVRAVAREVLEWLDDNEQGAFDIRCGACQTPFIGNDGAALAAPAEWFGGLEWERALAREVLRLSAEVERLQRWFREEPSPPSGAEPTEPTREET